MFKKTQIKTLLASVLIGSMAAVSTPAMANNEAMMDLLKVLRDKGSISQAEYEVLANSAKADAEKTEAMKAEVKEEVKEATKKLSWAEKIKIKGDGRFRYENIVDEGAGTTTDRFRYRARLGAYADVNDELKAGMRFASNSAAPGSGGSATSTNADLEDNFAPIGVDIDLAYLDWAPGTFNEYVKTNLVFGKMKQPWEKVNDMVWDGDTNPEGIAAKFEVPMDGFTLMPSFGYYVMNDIAGVSFAQDAHLLHGQLAAQIGKPYTLGVSYYAYQNDGGAQNEEKMLEVFGEATIPGLPLPLTVFGSYVTNTNDTDELPGDEQDAYSLGLKTKYSKFKGSWEYRDVGINAVNGNFDNSDFVNDSKGHILKLGYSINKNFDFGTTYFLTETNGPGSVERDRLQVDLKAKF